MCVAHSLFVLQLFMVLATSVGSDAPGTEDRGTQYLIGMSAPAAPPDSVEARIALRQHREVAALNRFTFPGNVLQGSGDLVDHWIVMFCPGWHEKCQGLLPSYELLGVQWENKLNKGLMSSSARFAKVDCATEKALCVSLDIDDYPSVVHYRNNQRVASWHGGAPGLVRFVKHELEAPKRGPSSGRQAARKTTVSACDALSPYDPPASVSTARAVDDRPSIRTVCFALMLLAAAHRAWVIASAAVFRTRQGHASGSLLKEQQCQPSSSRSTQGCLPQEWAHERSTIVL